MSAYFNPLDIEKIADYRLTIDTNIISSCFSDTGFFNTFRDIFQNNFLLIDPIVKLEFLRNEFRENFYKEKINFVQFEDFYLLPDHQEIYKKTYENAFNIARIYSHHGNSKVPLGDLMIIARLMIYKEKHLFVTLDKNDFSTFLFDRVTVLSIEKNANINNQKRNILEHVTVLRFNHDKYEDCLKKLPE